ncbi:threonine--tRNA ligase [bacterium]|nr:threonine--tRNA ligase [bacterium]
MSQNTEPKNKLFKIRHSASHIMAMAVLKFYPDAKLAIGPPIDDGFYYDFDLGDKTISVEDFKKIEKEMWSIINSDIEFKASKESIAAAKKRFKDQPYKLESIEDLAKEGESEIGLYQSGDFIDLCKGPHVGKSKEIGAFKLLKVAGAYWRGDEKKKMLQRVYGTAYGDKPSLNKHLKQIEEAEKRDHRKIGAELDLFTFSELVGGGLPMFTPYGQVLRDQIEKFLEELQIPHGYKKVWIPHIAKKELYQTSGHWDKFSDDIFHVSSKGEEAFVLKPMNCPHHIQIYASQARSYRDLPIRYFEVTAMYRDEQTGQLHGLSRVRAITIDDAHCFCQPDQVEAEVKANYDIIQEFYKVFDMPLEATLSLRDPKQADKYIGDPKVWDMAEDKLRQILQSRVKDFKEYEGEAAFYGPKIDFKATDAIGREWQLATIQLDFSLPERFELEYIDQNSQKTRPVMLHRAISGSLERFLSILIENYAGAFPTWLAPVQVGILPVSGKFNDDAKKLGDKLTASGIRVEIDEGDDTVSYKIRKAAKRKLPYVLVFGDKEKDGQLNVRVRGQEKMELLDVESFIKKLQEQIKNKS